MKKIVIFGGGTGLSTVLRGIKSLPIEITAVITVSDDGRSTGKLRQEFNSPAVGDIRKVLTNLSLLPDEMKDVMEYRFATYSDLNGHPVGNLLLTAALNKLGSLESAIKYMSKLLDVHQKILPLSEDYLTLMGETMDGRIIEGEENITKSHEQYKRIFYKEEPHVLKEVLDSIRDADLVILSMGSLYTSLLPHLICRDIQKALKSTDAKIMYVSNAMTQPGETDNFGVSDHIKVIENYIGKQEVDVVVASNTILDQDILKKYETEEQKDQVFIDYPKLAKQNVELIEADLLTTESGTIRHNSMKLSSLIYSYLMR